MSYLPTSPSLALRIMVFRWSLTFYPSGFWKHSVSRTMCNSNSKMKLIWQRWPYLCFGYRIPHPSHCLAPDFFILPWFKQTTDAILFGKITTNMYHVWRGDLATSCSLSILLVSKKYRRLCRYGTIGGDVIQYVCVGKGLKAGIVLEYYTFKVAFINII
jgi:hypothetical protein